ncbi:MAG TPA: hypothetical protein VHU91_04740 [Mycobacteriales bacterium]|jgi:hypothetical protein|nr:hypothetical protein [Mycobacteriales bacterium]
MTNADETQRSMDVSNVSAMEEVDIDDLALLRDDVLIDALAKGVFPAEYADDPMVNALWSWRDDIVHGPVALSPVAAVTTSAETEDIHQPEPAARPRFDWSWLRAPRLNLGRRLAVSLVAAAIGVVSLGSVAVASSAQPGDTLWPLSKVVNGKRAQSLEAKEAAFSRLRDARTAAKSQNTATARARLEAARNEAEKVRDKDGKEELKQELALLQARLDDPTGSPSPSAPPTRSPAPSGSPSPSPSGSPAPTESPSPSMSPTDSPSASPPAPAKTRRTFTTPRERTSPPAPAKTRRTSTTPREDVTTS